jgi:DNA-binding NarL/FixJ family response regulator
MKSKISILLADDHLLLRKGLRLLIESEEGFSVVSEANDGQEAIEKVREFSPDIVVMDINMPNLNGIDATRQILAESPQTRVLALSINSAKQFVESMFDAGASGYLLKQCAPAELIQAITDISEGKAYISTDIAEIVLERMRQLSSPENLSSDNLVASKLCRPQVSAEYVRNPHLIEKLEGGHNKKLTLISAPDNSGKTSLTSSWLEQSEIPSVWLTLDKTDNELPSFLISLLDAIHTLHPHACSQVQSLIEAANVPPVKVIANILADDLEQIPQRFLLVLEDYDQISSKTIHDLINALLNLLLPTLGLVVVTNKDPLLPLAALRVNNEISELRLENLRPDTKETVHWRDILTNREYEVLLLLEQRFRNKEIAEKLFVSEETVKSHLKVIYSKLNADNRRDVIVKAVKLGVL